MSGITRIVERCVCGATFRWDSADGPYRAQEAANAFRTNHQHERPERLVGRCTESAPPITGPDPDGYPSPRCSLDHGHTGAHHHDDSGADWWINPNTPTTEGAPA